MKADRKDWIWFGIVAFIYILWVIWLNNFWFLFGLGVIFDMYITKKVNWSFWKKRNGDNSKVIEWLDALIFAVIAVTLINIFLFQNYKIPTGSMENTLLVGDHLYVSKAAYGPRLPNTPLSFPFTQHTMPLVGGKSYIEWIKMPYKRLAGFGKIKRNDAVVFNFPAGDTVVLAHQNVSYYSIVRDSATMRKMKDQYYGRPLKSDKQYYNEARAGIWKNFDISIRPVDKRDNYIKRCVGIPGDTLRMINKRVYINGIPQEEFPGLQHNYYIFLKEGQNISNKVFDRMEIYEVYRNANVIQVFLTQEELDKISEFKSVQQIIPNDKYNDPFIFDLFPHDTNYRWSVNNYGPLYIPAKGSTVKLDTMNLCLYERIIGYYEKNDLSVKDGIIYINGQPATEYTFKMDYYWMMGDNRHSSLDSRFWGFVPDDHIIGKPKLIWLSLDRNKNFLGKIRWERMLKRV